MLEFITGLSILQLIAILSYLSLFLLRFRVSWYEVYAMAEIRSILSNQAFSKRVDFWAMILVSFIFDFIMVVPAFLASPKKFFKPDSVERIHERCMEMEMKRRARSK